METNYKIAIADDHKLILSGIKTIIIDYGLGEIVGEVNNGLQLLILLQTQKVDLVILDVNMPELNGIETAKKIMENYSNVSILMLSQYENIDLIKELKQIGVKGYLSKNFEIDQLVKSIAIIKKGFLYFPLLEMEQLLFTKETINLTHREKEILTLIANGKTSKEIANMLFLSQFTVDTHRKNCMRKFGVNTIINLINIAKEKGYIM